MPLIPGSRLGVYQITAPIGEGGMGQVYRARDTKLDRDVAIKVLPEAFAHDADRLARFTREAKTLALLNHPNIAAIYGLEESPATSSGQAGITSLVMELVEGEDLSQRIARGAIPIDAALPIAKQIAEALEAAHEQGIIHRDLKPANIRVRTDGTVKVLDFGLAKAMEQTGAMSASASQSPTTTRPAITEAGMILGTAGYMSPEQARGQAVDKRADIWAFGVVLYEMVTGEKLFRRDDMSDAPVSILDEEPQWSRVPEIAQRLLRSCLQRDPKQRLRDIGDAWRLLEKSSPAGPTTRSTRWKVAAAAAVVVAVVSTTSFLIFWRAPQTAQQPLVALNLDLGADVSLAGAAPAMDLSPDGSRLAFISQGPDGIRHVLTRRLDRPNATVLAKTDGALGPFFSPDGRWIGFFANNKLKKISVEGGEPIVLCEAPQARGASWGEDDGIIAALDTRVGLVRVPAAGGTPTPLTQLDLERGEASHRWPQILPGGKAVLYTMSTVGSFFEGADIMAVSLVDHSTKTIVKRAGMYGRYLPSGHLVYVSSGTLYAVPFDPDGLVTTGARVALLEDVTSNPYFGSAQLNFTQGGTLVYRTGADRVTIQWLDGAGRTEPLWEEPGFYQAPRVSPDGKLLVVAAVEGPDSQIWVYDWERRLSTRLTASAGIHQSPVWHPDGQHVVFNSPGGMLWARADGVGKPQVLTASTYPQNPNSFSPDGRRLAFSELNPGGGADIRILPVAAGPEGLRAGTPEPFLRTPAAAPSIAFSPDGHWLAYSSTESGAYQVYVRAYPDKGATRQISDSPSAFPVWSPNGRELFYRTGDQRIMVVDYTVKGDAFETGKPRPWVGQLLADVGNNRPYDLSPDGRRFAVFTPGVRQTRVMLLVNFFDEVRRRVAGR